MREIWEHVQPTGFCWIWTGPTTRDGYGLWRSRVAHRQVYEALIGPVPTDLELDHLCRIKACVNPDHLEPVTGAVNIRRRFALYTFCAQGHEFTAENTYMRPAGHRDCRTCIRDRAKRYRARRRAVA